MKLSIILEIIFIFFLHDLFIVSSKTAGTSKFINLWESKECKNEINRHCAKEKNQMNSHILKCLESSKDIIESLSSNCQHFLWDFKIKYLDLDYFNEATNNECRSAFDQLGNCSSVGENKRVICLVKHKSQVTNPVCVSNLNEVAAVLFSDVFLVHRFLTSCTESIRQLRCGRLETNAQTFSTANFVSRITSQGSTMECLVESLSTVNDACRQQILRLGELQSDDYHLNPNLFYACRTERESLCANTQAGRSRIYRCLERHKTHQKMSAPCRNALRHKNKLETYDYKIRTHFSDKCAKDIYEHKCVVQSQATEITELSTILVCLWKPGHRSTLSKDCRAEVLAIRTQLGTNHEMFPEFTRNCENEIKKHCSAIDKEKDSVIHCLMRYSMPALENGFNDNCLKSLKTFIQVVDPTEDISELDPVIKQVCSNELENQCSLKNYIEPDDRYQCLLQLIDEDKVQLNLDEDCKTHLLTLARFVDQEYSLNHKLFKMCHGDAVKHCGANDASLKTGASVVPHAIVHCLVRKWNAQYINREKSIISYKCATEIKAIMKIEASSLMLNFKIYTACSLDLMKLCKTVPHKMDCLQINYQNLKVPCRQSISDFLSLDAEEYSLKKLIARSCSPMVRLFCKDEVTEKKKDYMECLLRHKLDKTMDHNCRIAIEHYQIIGLDNYKIDHKFARFCSKEIKQFCSDLLPNTKKENEENENESQTTKASQITKSQIVTCLSKKLTLSLLQNVNPFSSQCYEQFTFEFIQQTNSVNFDPELRSICKPDIEHWCQTKSPENVLSCLHEYQDSLSENCVNLLFSRQQLSSLDVKFDVGVQRYCRAMITFYCSKIPSHKLFRCLHRNMRIEGFDAKCKKKIIKRLERRLVDLRLNPELIDNCRSEIKANCNISKLEGRISEMHFNDKHHIVNCLRYVYMEHRKFLGGHCRRQVFDIVLDAQSYVNLDPGLYELCQSEIKDMCYEPLVENNPLADGRVQDCLKHNLLSEKLHNEKCSKEVYRLLREGLADVHVDPQLYAACRSEISRICKIETLGQGRKLSCLLWAMEDKSTVSFMSIGCKTVLLDRKEMWKYATLRDAPESVKEVLWLVSESDSRYYFLSGATFLLLTILLVGILCGRYTRRAQRTIRKRR